MRVEQVMRTGERCPRALESATVRQALALISGAEGRAGAICVIAADGRLAGIFTDGDLRRRLLRGTSFLNKRIGTVMTANPKRVLFGSLAAEAGRIMKKHRIDELPVVGASGELCGVIDVQDMLAAGLMR
jgi:arabinose-5-phosphate isomerase